MAKLPFEKTEVSANDLINKNLPDAAYLGNPLPGQKRVRGWSSISNYMICDRMYYLGSIAKVKSLKASPALDIGVLAHACLAAHYSSGGVKTWEPIDAVQGERPELANEVKRLLYAYFGANNKEDQESWDVRAVEHEIVGYFEHNGIQAPASARSDLVVAKKEPGAAPSPYGPCAQGVYIVDHKFHARMSQDLTEGYNMDGQFLLMKHLWKQQGLDDVFGPLNGFIINIVTKTKNPECRRIYVDITDEDLNRFVATMSPVVTELVTRINAPDVAEVANWPMNYAVCKNPKGYGLCSFWQLCQSHGRLTELYQIASFKPTQK